jgi:hypothetical protein
MPRQLLWSSWGRVSDPGSRTVLPLAEVCKQTLGIDEVSLRGWYGLGTWKGCEMMLATFDDPGLFVVVFWHCEPGWFLETHHFGFFGIELHPCLFAPGLTCVHYSLEFASVS